MHPMLAAHLGHHLNHAAVHVWLIGVTVAVVLLFAVPLAASRESRGEREARARLRRAEDQLYRGRRNR